MIGNRGLYLADYSDKLLHDILEVAGEIELVVLVMEALQHVLEEFLESIICVFCPCHHVIEQVLTEFLLAFC